jgi:hypothetical protein
MPSPEYSVEAAALLSGNESSVVHLFDVHANARASELRLQQNGHP